MKQRGMQQRQESGERTKWGERGGRKKRWGENKAGRRKGRETCRKIRKVGRQSITEIMRPGAEEEGRGDEGNKARRRPGG